MLAALAASGDSDAVFARTHGIGLHRIRYWRSKLGTRATPGAPRFVPLRAISAAPAAEAIAPEGAGAGRHVELELSGGAQLRFVGEWDAAAITPWLQAVEARS